MSKLMTYIWVSTFYSFYGIITSLFIHGPGVVITEDTVVTETGAQENIQDFRALKFGILSSDFVLGETSVARDEVFSSSIHSLKVRDNMVLLVLNKKIPNGLFRPICIPPLRYLEKMVKPISCEGDKARTITKVSIFFL